MIVSPWRRAQLADTTRSFPASKNDTGSLITGAGRFATAGRPVIPALIGAGTWADDLTCAISATGEGEYFIRAGFARGIDMRLRHTTLDLDGACAEALAEVSELGGTGGCIALDPGGRCSLRCNTTAMARGIVREGMPAEIAIGADERLRPFG